MSGSNPPGGSSSLGVSWHVPTFGLCECCGGGVDLCAGLCATVPPLSLQTWMATRVLATLRSTRLQSRENTADLQQQLKQAMAERSELQAQREAEQAGATTTFGHTDRRTSRDRVRVLATVSHLRAWAILSLSEAFITLLRRRLRSTSMRRSNSTPSPPTWRACCSASTEPSLTSEPRPAHTA